MFCRCRRRSWSWTDAPGKESWLVKATSNDWLSLPYFFHAHVSSIYAFLYERNVVILMACVRFSIQHINSFHIVKNENCTYQSMIYTMNIISVYISFAHDFTCDCKNDESEMNRKCTFSFCNVTFVHKYQHVWNFGNIFGDFCYMSACLTFDQLFYSRAQSLIMHS